MSKSTTELANVSTDKRGVRAMVRPYRLRMAFLAVISFVGALLEAFFLVLVTGLALALVAGSESVGPVMGRSVTLGAALAIAAVALAARLALSLLGVRTSAYLTAHVTADQRRVLSHSFLRASWSVQQGEPAGRLQSLLTAFVTAAAAAVTTLSNAVVALLSLLALLGAGLLVDAGATGAVLVSLAVVGAVLIPLRRRIRQRSRSLEAANLSFANAVSELGDLGLEMQTFGVADSFLERIDNLTDETVQVQRRVQTLTGVLAPVYMSLAYFAVLVGVAILTFLDVRSLESIGAVMLLMLRSLSYGQQLASAAGSLASQAPFIDRLFETADRYLASPASTGTLVPAAIAPITADHVTFEYTPGRPALTDVNFRIEPGEVIGIIGPSGAGKSTVAQLMLGLREPSLGSLRVAGVGLPDVNRSWWAKRVAFVPQHALLLTGTVADNIRFFREGIDDAALRQAAEQANVLSDIEALPEGFDSHLGERGNKLSGGQRQRLSIARAVADSPDLLILDEPTSALDGRSESLIRDTLGALRGEVTVVIIAHRMSTLDICDRIMVIEAGRLTGFATPRELRQGSGFYREALAVAGIA